MEQPALMLAGSKAEEPQYAGYSRFELELEVGQSRSLEWKKANCPLPVRPMLVSILCTSPPGEWRQSLT